MWRSLARIVIAAGVLLGLGGLWGGPAQAQPAPVTITLLHHSDYHAQALPQYSEGQFDQGGLARAIGYIQAAKAASPNVLSLSGGDTLLPANLWSDEFKGEEWSWFNRGVVDVMALGNHDFDYGQDVFNQRHAQIDYPIISANFVRKGSGEPYLLVGGKPYVVKTVGGVRVGIFALADKSFTGLVAPRLMPPDTEWADAIPVARNVVRQLREVEHADLVVLIGHQPREDDEELARTVGGIDIIFGSHSHLKVPLTRLPGPNGQPGPYFISPYQYLTYLSRLDVTVQGGRVTGVKGDLVPLNARTPVNREIEARVNQWWGTLKAKYPERFVVIGRAAVSLEYDGINDGETILGNLVADTLRETAKANLFVSTSSSFRASIPPGDITVNDVRNALPFNNTIVTAELTGAQVRQLVDYTVSRRGSDFFSQVSGLRFQIVNGKAANVEILADPARPGQFEAVNDGKTYLTSTTNFQSNIAAGYKEIFQAGRNLTDTKLDVNETFMARIKALGTVTGALDGRIASPGAPAPAQTTRPVAPMTQLPRTGDAPALPLAIAGLLLILAGGAMRRARG